jgi:Kae1-associated kinase Bud32
MKKGIIKLIEKFIKIQIREYNMILAQGAEAIIEKKGNSVIKKRVSKGYRVKELDKEIIKLRTRAEAKNLGKINSIVNSPKVLKVEEDTIEMEFIEGEKLSSCLEKENYSKICKELGENIAKLHQNDIIHGDLTTSNFILSPNKEIFFLDLGLSFISNKVEDKAVDLHVLREALESKHHTIFEECFEIVKNSYGDKEVLQRLEKVELRGRNKNKG